MPVVGVLHLSRLGAEGARTPWEEERGRGEGKENRSGSGIPHIKQRGKVVTLLTAAVRGWPGIGDSSCP